MKIVISGAGFTGCYLAQILLKENHDLILIDKHDKPFRYAQEHLDAQIIRGDSASALTLEPIIDENTDLFVAVTDNDETNIVATLIARKFGAKRAILRVSDPTNLIHPLLEDDHSISVLNSDMIVYKDLIRLVGNPSADEIDFFANGKAELIRLHVPQNSQIIGKRLKEIEIPDSWLLIASIRRGRFVIASGEMTLEAGDQVLMVGNPEKHREIEQLLGLRPHQVHRIILIGYNDISSKIAQTLSSKNVEVRLIEESTTLAQRAAEELDDVLVINGDGTSEEILDQAGVDQTDYLIALTKDDETNVLISLLAKEQGVHRVVALTQKPQYKPIIEKIGIDSVVNPRSAMVDEVMRTFHYKDLSGISILEGGQGQVMEFIVKEKSTKILNIPLAKVKMPRQTLIGAIVRNDQLVIPRGDDAVKEGDRVVVFSTLSALSEVRKLFGTE